VVRARPRGGTRPRSPVAWAWGELDCCSELGGSDVTDYNDCISDVTDYNNFISDVTDYNNFISDSNGSNNGFC